MRCAHSTEDHLSNTQTGADGDDIGSLERPDE